VTPAERQPRLRQGQLGFRLLALRLVRGCDEFAVRTSCKFHRALCCVFAAFSLPATAAFGAETEPAKAVSPEKMAVEYKCDACHAVDASGVGPSYKQIAAKYKDQPGAAVRLKTRIRNGGSGVWGSVPMPPSPQIPTYELNEITNWILALK
jgi:cytochrome c551/c552